MSVLQNLNISKIETKLKKLTHFIPADYLDSDLMVMKNTLEDF